jgi:hypothetical protein
MSLLSIAVGLQSLISEGKIGGEQTRLSWFQRMRAAFCGFERDA